MSNGCRIPRSIDAFNPYIINTSSYLKAGTPLNAERLGLTRTEGIKWEEFMTAWAPLYLLYSDKKNSRTTAVIDQLQEIINQCVTYDQTFHILDRIAASPNVTIVDLETFNIKKGPLQKSTRTIPVTPIAELVTVILQPVGGGLVKVKCYSPTGQRAAIHVDADCVQYAYTVGTTPPASVKAEELVKDLSSKATFTLTLGAENAAQYLYIYFRWYNTRHPELNGPWSPLNNTLLL
jgi:hypothetical protein